MIDGIVIPCYNEATRLNTAALVDFCRENLDIVFCLVNDGSRDNTINRLTELQNEIGPHRIDVVNLSNNQGKAAAIHHGVLNLFDKDDLRTVGDWDADFSTPLAAVLDFRRVLSDCPDVQVVTGCRFKRLGATVVRNVLRHYLGRVGASLISLKLGIGVYDTQCGAKLFRTAVARQVFTTPFCSSWLFDVEIFARLIKILGIDKTQKMVYEYPLTEWKDQAGSKITPLDYLRSLYELIFRI